ncbi:zinc ribbon domain-containing protein [Nocardia blacklockiae]|uniref:zinc ribbon domain-containing protein n=1 Tax=Nocardia blacklockiae TaxID=480036 RepID=UPI001894AC79|nr:zinc ribbon domain-containing protein [Nocardia blacklockiae]MBF6169956.1 zinc ribbon domain-containing protein [Nocardia blacklockiae]
MRCPGCHFENPDGYTYCGGCGRKPDDAGSAQARLEESGSNDEATRYLCAAVHFDSTLARIVVENVLEEPRRAVAHSPAVNLDAVCRHAVAARRHHIVRDLALSTLLLGFVLYTLFGPSELSLGFFVVFDLFNAALGGALYLAVLGWCIVFAEGYLARWGPTARGLRQNAFRPADAPAVRAEPARGQLPHVARSASGNVTVYQGYNPFMGHGWSVRGWSFALDVTKPDRDGEPVEPFTVTDLYQRLTKGITDLDIPAVKVYDRLFVNGADAHHDGRFVPDPEGCPVDSVDDATMSALMAHPEDHARPYLTTEIVGWQGEFVWSAFVRLVISDTSLFVEANYCVLPPLREIYHEIDDLLLRPSPKPVLRLMWRSLRALPRLAVRCVPSSLHHVLAPWRFRRKMRRQQDRIEQSFTFDHGAVLSVREAASDLRRHKGELSLGYQRHFQFLDEQMYTKTVEKRVIDTLSGYLAEHNIATAELRRRAEQIVNSNVTIGGDVHLVNSAIGGMSAVVSMAATQVGRKSQES